MTGESVQEQHRMVVNTLNELFANNHEAKQKRESFRKQQGIDPRELEVALAVLLVDLASCDDNFEPQEFTVIQEGLSRLFGTSKEEVSSLVNQAKTILANLRGSTSSAELLHEHLSDEQKEAVLCVIDQVIDADGVEDGFEVYLRHKFRDLLGLPESS